MIASRGRCWTCWGPAEPSPEGSALKQLLTDDTFATLSFGTLCLEQGLVDEAAQIFLRLLGRDPGHARAREGLEEALRLKTRNDGKGPDRMVVSTAEFKKGMKIQFDGAPYTIVDFQHVKPGKGGAFVRTKLKHMKLGRVIDNTFRAGEKVELVDFEEKRMQFLYKDDRYNFMDLDTYDQISLSAEEVGDARDFLKENTEVEILFIDASPVTVELPNFIELQIAKTDPGIRGDTASGGSKPATLETGAVVQVPLFLNEGDVVKVDTRSGEYLGRVSAAG